MDTSDFDDHSEIFDSVYPLLDEIEGIIARGGTYVDAYYRVRSRLEHDWPKKRFFAAANDPDTVLGQAIADGRAKFSVDYMDLLWMQGAEGGASAPRLLAEHQAQQTINAAIKRFFPEL